MVSRHSFDFTFAKGNANTAVRHRNGSPMRLLVMGGFQGHSETSGIHPLAASNIRRVDIDNFDQLLAMLAPTLDLVLDPPNAAPTRLVFRSLEDFHPDRLAERDPVLTQLHEIKRRLQEPATCSEAATSLTRIQGVSFDKTTSEAQQLAATAQPEQEAETDDETLERLLGTRPIAASKPTSRQRAVVDEFVQRLVAPQVVPDKPDTRTYVEAADRAAGDRLRFLLHHPDFQRLEASWRSLFELVSQIETDETVEFSILSLDAGQLREAVANPQDKPLNSPFGRLLANTSATTPDAQPWTTIVGDYLFGADASDIQVLSALGSICHGLGIGFLAGAQPALLGCPDLRTHTNPRDWTRLPADVASAWQDLRRSPASQAIGLALPRVLLRLPYGQETDPCELFSFEEMPGAPVHDAFLWGNPAFLCARVLAQAYCEDDEHSSPVANGDIADLPAFIDRQDPETAMQACAEVYLAEAVGEAISDAGCIPVLSFKRRNAVRIGPIRSLAIS